MREIDHILIEDLESLMDQWLEKRRKFLMEKENGKL